MSLKKILFVFSISQICISNIHAQTFSIPEQVTFGSDQYDFLTDMILTPVDGYLVCGETYGGIAGDKTSPSFGFLDYWLVKFDNTLQPQWQKSFGGNSGDYSPTIINISSGGFLLVGGSGSTISGNKTIDTIGGGDIWVLKLNASGGVVWQNVYGGDSTETMTRNSIVELSDGSFVIGCSSISGISGNKTDTSTCLNRSDETENL